MKSLYTYILWMAMATFAWVSCTDEKLVETSGSVGDEEVAVTLNFMAQHNDPITVTTRATLDEVPESRVQNFFLFFFVKGTRVYSHYFDASNKLETANQVIASDENNWYVENKSDNDDETDITEGTIRAHVPQATGAKIYMVANIDADMVNISPEKLNTIRTEQELKDLTATLNQEITSRNGYFPMSGKLENVTINPEIGSGITVGGNAAHVELQRLDAKVEVFVRTATNLETSSTEDGVTTKQTLKGFVPESWRVVNLPKSCYVVGRDAEDYSTEYFNTDAVSFESSKTVEFESDGKTYTTTLHGFSFYMMENRPEATASVGDFHLRDMREKDPATGKYTTDPDNMWVYAPENGTYLEIKGEVEMEVDVSSEAKTQTLKANVTYYVHLGDIATDLNDYSINRNTHYRYTITIKGVDKITLEVETSQLDGADKVKEENAGATGNVYIAKESIHTFDAHYGQRVFCFDAAYIEAENMTWFVQTPFGKAGTPPSMDGVDIPAGYDYKWVEFLVNEETESVTDKLGKTLEVYSQKNQAYPGYKGNPYNTKSNDLMDVIAFTKYVKEEKIKLDKYLNEETATNTSVFRKEFDEAWYDKFGAEAAYRWRIYVTVFVNEFYYEEHPITGDRPTDLWKQFVNQPNRIMHILCDDQMSLDEASTSTGSVVTIRQRSIQTPYNISKESLADAWGCETVDEMAGKGWGFNENSYTIIDEGNYPTDNGLYNTACLWKLFTMEGSDSKKTVRSFNNVKWSDIFDYEALNDDENQFLLDNKKSMKYGALARNRDNNGNGSIDPEEVRWYIASLEQLYGLYLGGLGLNSDAQLYSSKTANSAVWRSHLVCSNQTTITNSGQYVNKFLPEMLWAEEGVSISGYGQEWQKQAPNSIRCVRNLGMSNPTVGDIISPDKNISTPLIRVDSPAANETVGTNTVYKFNLSNINEKSIRFYTTRELEPSDEYNEMSRTFYGFETDTKFVTYSNYATLKKLLDGGSSPCPEGYRVPNVREAALLSLYCPSTWWNGNTILSCSIYSHGSYGDNKDGGTQTWQFQNKYVTVNAATGNLRCVRDYVPTNN